MFKEMVILFSNRRILPNLKVLREATLTVGIKFPAQTDTASTYSPFTYVINDKKRYRHVVTLPNLNSYTETWRFGTVRIDLQPDRKIMVKPSNLMQNYAYA